jgi:hypothetical protein
MKFEQMNDDFAKYMEEWSEEEQTGEVEMLTSKASESRGRLSSGSDNEVN